jgi:hypothetical protein
MLIRKFSHQIFRLPARKALLDREDVFGRVKSSLQTKYLAFSKNKGLARRDCNVIYAMLPGMLVLERLH